MKLWLTRRPNGTYMLTAMRPVASRIVKGGGDEDCYIQPGEPIGILHLCSGGIHSLVGRELESMETVKIDLTSIILTEPEVLKPKRQGADA